jgi:hypothetical protein
MLEGVAMKFYTRSTPESDSEAAKSERHSSPDKSRGEIEKEVLSEWREKGEEPVQLLHESVRSRGTFNVACTSNCHCS